MMSEEDIKKYHELVEKLEMEKKNKTPVDDRGPADLTKRIEILEFRNDKLPEEIRSLRSKLYVKGN